MRTLLAALLLSASAFAADGPVAAFQAAMADNDAGAKKQAARALGAKDAGKDEEAYSALIGAIADRQAGEAAVSALQSRTGKTPVGGVYKAGDDPAKIQAAWQGWFDDWKKAQQIKKLEKKDEKKPAKPEAAVAAPGTKAAPASEKAVPPMPAEDLGRLDRVIFVAGGSLLCYVQSKRTDADGKLLSVRVIHPDGSGEETITADLVSRIEEDIQQDR